MSPAIALRLRQHLTLTPQVQQALRLLQMSALEFAQEMEQALTSNPFLEENAEAPAPREASASADEVIVPQEPASPGVSDREQEEWSGASEAQPSLQEHLREQLLLSRMGNRDRALAHMIIDSLDDDGYFKAGFDELAAMVPAEHDVRAEDFEAALRLVQNLDPAGVAARTLEECLELQLAALDEDTPGRACALALVRGRHLQLLGNREWARLQHALACDEATLHTARALIRTLETSGLADPSPILQTFATDRALGGLFGFCRGALLIGVFIIGGQLASFDRDAWWQNSRLIPYGTIVADWIRVMAPKGFDLLKPGATPEEIPVDASPI